MKWPLFHYSGTLYRGSYAGDNLIVTTQCFFPLLWPFFFQLLPSSGKTPPPTYTPSNRPIRGDTASLWRLLFLCSDVMPAFTEFAVSAFHSKFKWFFCYFQISRSDIGLVIAACRLSLIGCCLVLVALETAQNPKKCRAVYGLEQQQLWCAPCR